MFLHLNEGERTTEQYAAFCQPQELEKLHALLTPGEKWPSSSISTVSLESSSCLTLSSSFAHSLVSGIGSVKQELRNGRARQRPITTGLFEHSLIEKVASRRTQKM